MSAGNGVYSLVAFFVIFFGVILFFIDGMLLWSIGFFSLGMILIILKAMWGIAGWADNAVRRMGDD
jgi:hypothetical protein